MHVRNIGESNVYAMPQNLGVGCNMCVTVVFMIEDEQLLRHYVTCPALFCHYSQDSDYPGTWRE